jgi:ABC-type enterochelin transport system ATPase subunit
MVIMGAGRVTHQGACADIATHRALEHVFEGRIAIHALGQQWVALPLDAA